MVLNPDAVGQREPKYQPHGSHRSTKAFRAPEASSQWDPPPFSTLPTLPPPETTMAGQENRQRVGLPVQGRVVGRVGPLRTKHFLRPLLLSRPLPCPLGCREQRAHLAPPGACLLPPTFCSAEQLLDGPADKPLWVGAEGVLLAHSDTSHAHHSPTAGCKCQVLRTQEDLGKCASKCHRTQHAWGNLRTEALSSYAPAKM